MTNLRKMQEALEAMDKADVLLAQCGIPISNVVRNYLLNAEFYLSAQVKREFDGGQNEG
jgi:hypothetical protein